MDRTRRPIKDFELYEIDRRGNVYSVKSGRKLRPVFVNKSGFKLNLMKRVSDKRNKAVSASLHRLIATTYIPNPDNCKYVVHLDNNYRNFTLNNLAWSNEPISIMKKRRGNDQ